MSSSWFYLCNISIVSTREAKTTWSEVVGRHPHNCMSHIQHKHKHKQHTHVFYTSYCGGMFYWHLACMQHRIWCLVSSGLLQLQQWGLITLEPTKKPLLPFSLSKFSNIVKYLTRSSPIVFMTSACKPRCEREMRVGVHVCGVYLTSDILCVSCRQRTSYPIIVNL